ncbi:hypothetical protein [Brachybacterium sp. p3-SID957]|uniref:hypothetical protein n=1 Tax=Brachybacterium sp. p3-SID957 TaxID=2916049 RepID=UPI00223ABC79|nr:hypothetical protein [Brachybacterium sp. p3-SID957]MCT1775016.1 hypothetical protein [Brachybacterium sp. p3-SID957]
MIDSELVDQHLKDILQCRSETVTPEWEVNLLEGWDLITGGPALAPGRAHPGFGHRVGEGIPMRMDMEVCGRDGPRSTLVLVSEYWLPV